MTKYFDENPAYAHLRMKWELESDEDVHSKAKTLTGIHLRTAFHRHNLCRIDCILLSVQSFEINQGEELVELEQELNGNGYDGFKFNMDDFFGDTTPHLNNSLAHRRTPLRIFSS